MALGARSQVNFLSGLFCPAKGDDVDEGLRRSPPESLVHVTVSPCFRGSLPDLTDRSPKVSPEDLAVKDLRSLWISDVPGDVSLEALTLVLEEELGLSTVRAREHASNLASGSIARIYTENDEDFERARIIFGRLGCRLEDALESRAS